MTGTPGPEVGDILLGASYRKEDGEIEGGFAGVFAAIAQRYYQKYGDQGDALARIAAKNHRNGCANPWAQIRKDLGYDFCRGVSDKNPIVASPLKRTDCSPGIRWSGRRWCSPTSRRPSPSTRRWCSGREARSTTFCR